MDFVSLRKTFGIAKNGAVFLLALGLMTPAYADVATLSDGALSLTINENGSFYDISLNGLAIDLNGFDPPSQIYNINGQYGFGISQAISHGVSVSGTTATYSALTDVNSVQVDVTTRILPGVASDPTHTRILEQTLFFTSRDDIGTRPIQVVSRLNPNLRPGITDGLGHYEAARQMVAITNPSRVMAAIGQSSESSAAVGWDVVNSSTTLISSRFPMAKRSDAGPANIAASIGFDNGTLSSGKTQTLTFRYLFGVNRSTVPSDFGFGVTGTAAPEPGTLPLLAFIAGAIGFRRSCRRDKS